MADDTGPAAPDGSERVDRTLVGRRIDHYLIGEPLGIGGMGAVYRAEDVRLGRAVALKFVLPAESSDEERRGRILREARAVSALRSSNIASIYDIGEHDGSVFLVMELVEGEPLSAVIARGPLPVATAVDIGSQVADALDEAHAHGVVHRDIKSANLMVDARGRVKVLDFGLAKIVAPAAADTQAGRTLLETVAGTLLGTIAYMAPEQALARPVDGRADLFSLGVVLYEMLTGRLPFDGATPAEVFDGILHRDPPAIARFNYGVPPALEAIVLKALAKDPQFRFQTARELYIDLHGIRRGGSGTGAATESPAGGAPARTWGSDSSASVVPQPVKLDRAVAVMTFVNITREPADDWIGSGIAETVTTDLNRVSGLTVIGSAQVFDALKQLGRGTPAAFDERQAIAIGREVGASWIVGGGYQRMGGQIRITAQFVDVRTGTLVRTVKVDGRIDEIFDLQDRIVYELGQGLNLSLGASEIAGIERDETRSVDAYEAYSRGVMNLRMATSESLDRALAQFERAVAIDPEYANAWTGLGMALRLKGQFLSLPELQFKAIEALRRALALGSTSAKTQIELGLAYNATAHVAEAIDAIREAIRLDPTDANAHAALGRCLWVGLGLLDEGITELEHAVALNAEGGYSWLQLALLYSLRGHSHRAEAAARRAVELQERYLSGTEGLQIVGAHLRLGYVFYRQARYDEAIAEYERELVFIASGNHVLRERTFIEVNQKLSAASLRKGDRASADVYFDRAAGAFTERLSRGADDGATKYYVASMYALRGDAARAVRYLGESFTELKALNLARARLDPDFDPIRVDPAFQALLADAAGQPSQGPPPLALGHG
jgi:TolB-like protein/Tfp pilus assembly protein PilF/predicted Ser/Thr protein kinase